MAKQVESITEVVIRIYGVTRKWKEKPFLSCPSFSVTKQKYITGQEEMSESELQRQPLIINPEEHYPISHGDKLVLKQKSNGDYVIDRDYVLYTYYLTLPVIAKSKSEFNKNIHYYYIDNKEAEAREEVSVGKIRAKAFEYVTKLLTLPDMRDILFYLGENPVNYTQSIAEGMILKRCVDNPNSIVKYFEDETRSKLVFVKKCLMHGLLTRGTNNYIYYGQVICGANEFEASAFLYDEKNSIVYTPLYDSLQVREGLKK